MLNVILLCAISSYTVCICVDADKDISDGDDAEEINATGFDNEENISGDDDDVEETGETVQDRDLANEENSDKENSDEVTITFTMLISIITSTYDVLS